MGYDLDQPIVGIKDDRLSRKVFVKNFSKDLLELRNSKGSFTIALNGIWGSGKTSLINLIKEEINNSKKNNSKKDKSLPIIIDFHPWNITNEDDIIKQFFNTFMKKVNVKSLIGISIELIQYLTVIPKYGFIFKILNIYLKSYLNNIEKDSGNLSKNKEKIKKQFQKSKCKYIIFIDDIDRLNKKEIKLIFQLIKAVFDFPNVIFVLAYDKDIVVKALEEEQTLNGNEYLEKLVQLTIDIPEPKDIEIERILMEKLNELTKENKINEDDINNFNVIMNKGFINYFKTIRKVNLYINELRFNLQNYLLDLNIIDILVMEAFRLFEPNLLTLLKENKLLLCGEKFYSSEEYNKEINRFNERCKKTTENFKLVEYIFPILNMYSFISTGINKEDLKAKGSICILENFNKYCTGILDVEGITREKVLNLITSFSDKEKYEYLSNVSYDELEEILMYLGGFAQDKDKNNNILEIMGMFFRKDNVILNKIPNQCEFHISIYLRIAHVLINVFNNIDREESFTWIKSQFENSNNNLLLIRLIYCFGSNFGIYGAKSDDGFTYFTNEQIYILHKIIVDKVIEIINKDDFIYDKNNKEYLTFLMYQNNTIVKDWFIKQNDSVKYIMIGSFVDVFNVIDCTGSKGQSYKYPFNKIEKTINIEELKKEVDKEIKSKDANKYNKAIVRGLVVFTMEPRDNPYSEEEIKKYCFENKIEYFN